jgi:acyltransferase
MKVEKKRYYWVDATKALGIFLVFYGHLLETARHLSADAVYFQYKLIYSFHMPLFFFIAGFFYKRQQSAISTQIGILFQKRLFPVLLFSAIALLIRPVYSYIKFGEIYFPAFWPDLQSYLMGRPAFSATLWFLVCLFTVEIFALLLLPRVRTVLYGVLIAFFFLLFGHSLRLKPDMALVLPRNFWYIHESFLAFGLYALGYSTFRWIRELIKLKVFVRGIIIVLLGSVLVWAVNMNSPVDGFAVDMKISMHGNFFFFISAFAGILMIILFASLLPQLKWIEYIGKNTLILLGTNGLFISFFNTHILDWLDHYDNVGMVFLDSVWISALSIILSIPLIEILNRWLPQLVGKPQVDGPVLKAFPPPKFLFLRRNFEKALDYLGSIKA